MTLKLRYHIFISLIIVGVLGADFPAYTLPVPENGVQREYHPNGNLRLENVYKHGRLVRKRVFYSNGKLLLQEIYKDGKLISKSSYYENGNVKSLWTQKSGVTKFYYENGQLRVIVDNRPGNLNKNLPSSYIFSGESK